MDYLLSRVCFNDNALSVLFFYTCKSTYSKKMPFSTITVDPATYRIMFICFYQTCYSLLSKSVYNSVNMR